MCSIVFRVDALTTTNATLTWKIVDYCYGLSDPRSEMASPC